MPCQKEEEEEEEEEERNFIKDLKRRALLAFGDLSMEAFQ